MGLTGLRGSLLILKKIKVNQKVNQEQEEVLHFIDIMLPCQGNVFSQNPSRFALSFSESILLLCDCVFVEREFLLRKVKLHKEVVMLRVEQQLLWLQPLNKHIHLHVIFCFVVFIQTDL